MARARERAPNSPFFDPHLPHTVAPQGPVRRDEHDETAQRSQAMTLCATLADGSVARCGAGMYHTTTSVPVISPWKVHLNACKDPGASAETPCTSATDIPGTKATVANKGQPPP